MNNEHVPKVLSIYIILSCLVLVAPIVIVCVIAFGGEGYVRFPPTSYSTRWFEAFFYDSRWMQSLLSSTLIGLIACAIATVLGFATAYALIRGEFRAKKLVLSFMLMPIIVPTVITAIAMYFITARFGLVGNMLWIGFCHAVIAYPIVVLILLSALQGVEPNLEKAALSLGAGHTRMFFKIVVPLAMPGVMSGALFAFLSSFDELVISLFLSGARAQTLPVRIWNSLHLEIEPVIAAAAAFLVAVTGLVLLLDGLNRGRKQSR